jgi:hypothetical protein
MFPYVSLMTAAYPAAKGDIEVRNPEGGSASNAARRL